MAGSPADALSLVASPATDEAWMQRALEAASVAESRGEVPVGAVLVRDDELLATGENRVIHDADPTAHAEIVALRAAAKRLGNYRLPGTTMFVTLEPCAMCAGALVNARVQRVVFAARDPRAGASGSVFEVLDHPMLNHRCRVDEGVCGEQASERLRNFFRARRKPMTDS